jgi:hypothetical protein
MQSIRKDIGQFHEHLRSGSIQKAYKALLSYMMALRTHFKNKRPNDSVSGLYQGYLDMTYFALVSPALKNHGLKIAIVFSYGAFRFEAWLAGTNRQIQRKYWELVKNSRWTDYRVVAPAKGVDSILECTLAENFDLSNPDSLTESIDEKAGKFIHDVEAFLSRQKTPDRA